MFMRLSDQGAPDFCLPAGRSFTGVECGHIDYPQSQCLACQVNEHIFQAGAHDVHIDQVCAVLVDRLDDPRQDCPAVGRLQADFVERIAVQVARYQVGCLRQLLNRLGQVFMPAADFHVHDLVLVDAQFQVIRRVRAMILPWSMMPMRSESWSASSM
jgi:hypothetical protein